jgi:hypothetical protein
MTSSWAWKRHSEDSARKPIALRSRAGRRRDFVPIAALPPHRLARRVFVRRVRRFRLRRLYGHHFDWLTGCCGSSTAGHRSREQSFADPRPAGVGPVTGSGGGAVVRPAGGRVTGDGRRRRSRHRPRLTQFSLNRPFGRPSSRPASGRLLRVTNRCFVRCETRKGEADRRAALGKFDGLVWFDHCRPRTSAVRWLNLGSALRR